MTFNTPKVTGKASIDFTITHKNKTYSGQYTKKINEYGTEYDLEWFDFPNGIATIDLRTYESQIRFHCRPILDSKLSA